MTPQGHDDLTWTWSAPGGAVFTGSADYIAGCRAGWEALAAQRPPCKFSSTCEHAHPDDIANHTDGGQW